MTDHKPKLGFIGLGLMGQPMCLRLLAAGYELTVLDINHERLQPLLDQGAKAAQSPAEVIAASDIVLLCLISTAAVEAVITGDKGIINAATAGKVVVDFSTSDAAITRKLAERLKLEADVAWVDAPVSGGPPAAAKGELTIMAGGTEDAIAKVRPVVEELAGRFTVMGPVGAGQVTKMINQVLVLNNFSVMAEALKLAENNDVDASKIPDCLAGGYADGTMLQHFFPRMIARDFEPAGFARQVLKDLDLVYDLAKTSRTPTPMSDQTRMLYRLLISHGHSELDAIAILKLYDTTPL